MTMVISDEKPEPVLSTQETPNSLVRAKALYTRNIRKSKFAAADDSLAKNEVRSHVSNKLFGKPNQTCEKEYSPAAGCSNTSQKPTTAETSKKSLVREAILKFSEKSETKLQPPLDPKIEQEVPKNDEESAPKNLLCQKSDKIGGETLKPSHKIPSQTSPSQTSPPRESEYITSKTHPGTQNSARGPQK